MEKINQFKRKGGIVLWIEGFGSQATGIGEPQKMLIDMESADPGEISPDRDVYRCTDDEWNNPPDHLTRCKVFFG